MSNTDQPGGSGAGRTVPPTQQNVVIDANAQAAAAQLAQQILANTNVTLKQELVKIPDFWGEKGKDTVTATQFMARIDECQVANDWNDTTTYANFSLCLKGEADEWLASKVRLLELTAAQRTWTRIRPLFKKEFAACSDDKLIIDGLANLAHRPGENPRKFMSRLEKLFNTLHEKTTLHTGLNQNVRHQFNHRVPTPRTCSRPSPMTVSGPTTNFSSPKCSGPLLRKM
jgi:hypothetical protein